MDIAQLSMGLSQANLMSQVGYAVMGMQLDQYQTDAASEVAALQQMPAQSLETLVNPNIGSNIDLTV